MRRDVALKHETGAAKRVEPRGSPGMLQGHADAVPVVHFCAAAPVHIPAAVDREDRSEVQSRTTCIPK